MNTNILPLWIQPEILFGETGTPGGGVMEVVQGHKTAECRLDLLHWISELGTDYAGILWGRGEVRLSHESLERLFRAASDARSVWAYANYRSGDTRIGLYDLGIGSVSDKTDTGPLWIVHTETAKTLLAEMPNHINSPALIRYALHLGLMRQGIPLHLPETLTHAVSRESTDIFSYLQPDWQDHQRDAERIFGTHLKNIGAHLPPRTSMYHDPLSYPVHASVIIPVRNRERTIGDAVRSALDQKADFDFNVIVVNNHSADETGPRTLAAGEKDTRLRIISPKRTDLEIGGCWNLAARAPFAGRYLVQLDSDDVFAVKNALKVLVDTAASGPFAMTVGSYRTVDFEGNTVSPGDILHSEWTDDEGHNNLLRVAGVGAPRVYATGIVRKRLFPNVSYGEDYAMALIISRSYRIARNHEILYLARRWEGNTDYGVDPACALERDRYKDHLRTIEIRARQILNARRL